MLSLGGQSFRNFFSYYVSSHMSIIWHTGLLSSLAKRRMFANHCRRSNRVVKQFFLYYCSARQLDKEEQPLNKQDDAFSHTSIVWHNGLLFSLAERGMFAHDGLRSKGVVGQFFSARWRGKEKLTLIWQDDAFSHMFITWHAGLLSSLARSDVCWWCVYAIAIHIQTKITK